MYTRFLRSMRTLQDARRGRAGRAAIGLTPFDLAQRSWARSIAAYTDVPVPYRPFFEPLQAAGVPFPLVVIAPTYEGFLHRETEKLVCAASDEVCVLERHGAKLDVVRYPLPRITCLEVSSVLLDARIKIMGLEGDGLVPISTTIRFNAVTDFLFAPIVARIRRGEAGSKAAPAARSDPFNAWGRDNFKFMNYAKRSLVGDEVTVQAVLQREIRVGVLSAFGRTYRRTLSPTHATILTDRELITIEEILPKGDRERYGGLWGYMPLDRIESLSMTGVQRDLVTLCVDLFGGGRRQFQFEPSAREELAVPVGKFTSLKEERSRKAARPSPE